MIEQDAAALYLFESPLATGIKIFWCLHLGSDFKSASPQQPLLHGAQTSHVALFKTLATSKPFPSSSMIKTFSLFFYFHLNFTCISILAILVKDS
jgi:hypothetical protein